MRISVQLSDDLAAGLAEDVARLSNRLKAATQAAADALQADLRGQVRAAGLGLGLEKAWNRQVYPKSGATTLHPAALVFSKATLLHDVFVKGATIRARRGRYLAIPTREAEAMGLAKSGTTRGGKGVGAIPRRASMVADAIARLGDKNIEVLPGQRGQRLIAYRRPVKGGAGRKPAVAVVLFILVPTVRLNPRLDLAGAIQRATANFAAEIGAAVGG